MTAYVALPQVKWFAPPVQWQTAVSLNSNSPVVMKVGKMVSAVMKGLERDRYEIRPGTSNLLKVMSRLAPDLMLKQLSRSVAAELAKLQPTEVK